MFDPNELLAELLGLAQSADKLDNAARAQAQAQVVDRLLLLDQWLAGGGYKPERWAARGVDMAVSAEPALQEAISRLQGALKGGQIAVRGVNLILTQDSSGAEGNFIACLATHSVQAASPVVAVEQLREIVLQELRANVPGEQGQAP